eukprot:GFYU01018991.1.p1 GENE.GFYU01018991.1~~GFYU01018991.1.p1  ORF type:complete len:641 (-),score=-4.72 GFYU01018991.1:77-1972(-)
MVSRLLWVLLGVELIVLANFTRGDQPSLPHQVKQLHDRAIKSVHNREFSKARQLLQRAIDIVPEHHVIRSNFGHVLNEEASPESAEVELRKAIDIAPAYASAYLHLTRSLRLQRRFHDALRVVEDGVEVGTQSPALIENLALSLSRVGKYKDAAKKLRKAHNLKPKAIAPLVTKCLGLAQAYKDRLDLLSAVDCCMIGLSVDENNVELRIALADIYSMRNEHNKSSEVLDHILASDPKNPVALKKMAELEVPPHGKTKLEVWNDLYSLVPNDWECLVNLGIQYSRQATRELYRDVAAATSMFKEASTLYQKATALGSNPELKELLQSAEENYMSLRKYDGGELRIVVHLSKGGLSANLNKVLDHVSRKTPNMIMHADWEMRPETERWHNPHFAYGEVGDNIWELFFKPLTPASTWEASTAPVVHVDSFVDTVIGGHAVTSYFGTQAFQQIRERMHGAWRRYIRVRSATTVPNEVNEFYETNLSGKYVIGVHVRTNGHKVEQTGFYMPTVAEYVRKISRLLEANANSIVFLATDDSSVISPFVREFGDRIVFRSGVNRLDDRGGFSHLHMAKPSKQGINLAKDLLIDASLLAHSDIVLHVRTNVVLLASFINPRMDMVYMHEGISWEGHPDP